MAYPGPQKIRSRKQRVAKIERQLKGVQQPVGRKEHMAQTEEAAAAAAAVAVVGSLMVKPEKDRRRRFSACVCNWIARIFCASKIYSSAVAGVAKNNNTSTIKRTKPNGFTAGRAQHWCGCLTGSFALRRRSRAARAGPVIGPAVRSLHRPNNG